MKRICILMLAILGVSPSLTGQSANPEPSRDYTLVVEGFDWGPAVSKVILDFDTTLEEAPAGSFRVQASRSTDLAEIPEAFASGERSVLGSYVSDAEGNRSESGTHLTLILGVGPRMPLSSPFHYANNDRVRGNFWVDYRVSVTHMPSLRSWDQKTGKVMPLVDRFDLDGVFEYAPGKQLTYASYTPSTAGKRPLIIWLHGGGEGGTDPTIPLLGNRAANYASDEIQALFGGAFVLAPQTPTFWMNAKDGEYTRGDKEDIYHVGLMALIEDYVSTHPEIDRDRIYVGGCSNGGYMSLKLILEHPEYFAAGYISALAYHARHISDAQLRSIRRVPIWFMHSKDDPVTIAAETAIPVYRRLKEAGARDVYLSLYDHVVDISGQYGGGDFYYSGHWSWIYSHANKAYLDADGSPVTIDGRPVRVMDWLAEQER